MRATRIIAALLVALVACTADGGDRGGSGSGGTGDGIVLAAALQPFDSCDELLNYFQTEALKIVGPYGLDGGPMVLEDFAAGGEESGAADVAAPRQAPAAGGDQPQAGVDFSGTNVQEEGVDEPDFVKTNGRLVYTLAQGKLQIVDLANAGQVLSTLTLPGYGHELLLDGDRLLVMATDDKQYGGPQPVDDVRAMPYPAPYSQVSVLSLVDVSDPADPVVQVTLTLDGAYRSARMVDGVARVVLTSSPTGLQFAYPEGGGLRAERAATEENRRIIRESTIENWLPYYVLEDRRGGNATSGEGVLLDCEAVSRPDRFSGLGLVSVLSIDLADTLKPESGQAIVASGETVYASPNNLYVATNRWIDPAVAADPARASESAPDDYSTEIHQFDITDPARATYVASGSVRGHLLNQFSLSEHDGRLRVATTDGPPWFGGEGARSESFVTVLEPRDGTLVRVGQVGNLGRGEQIYAVRFLGDVGYVVTFRQTDPLYTIDLADASSPRVTGELKILGYSAYLHPVDDNLLLGVGQDADRQGRTRGTQLSLFDVSDPAAPRRLQQTKIANGYSEAEYDHRAFLYWPATRLAVVPVQQYSYNEKTGVENFSSGAQGFTVDRGGIAPIGRVEHNAPRYDPWTAQIRRSMVVDDTLVTISEVGLKVSGLDDFDDRSFVRFGDR